MLVINDFEYPYCNPVAFNPISHLNALFSSFHKNKVY